MTSKSIVKAKIFAQECLKYNNRFLEFVTKMGFFEGFEDFQMKILNGIDEMLKQDTKDGLVKYAVNGCKGGGKSCIACIIALCVLLIDKHAKIYYISPKVSQSQDIFINDVMNYVPKSKYSEMIEKVINFHSTSFTNSFTKQSARVLSFANKRGEGKVDVAGIHGDGINLIIYDEASGIPREVFSQTGGVVASGKCILLMFGNPEYVKPTYYSDVFLIDPGDWVTINVNFLELKYKSEAQFRNMLASFPEGTDNYKKYVLGEFIVPKSTSMVNFDSLNKIVKKIKKNEPSIIYHLEEDVQYYVPSELTYVGIDVSSGNGISDTVLTARTGNVIEIIDVDSNISLLELKDIITDIHIRYRGRCHFIIDADGVGTSLKPIIRNDPRTEDVMVTPFHNSGTKAVHFCYKTPRCQLYGQFSNYLDRVEEYISTKNEHILENLGYRIFIPDKIFDSVLRKIRLQTRATVYTIDEGRKSLTPKSSLAFSPDILDSIAYSFFYMSRLRLY